MAGAGAIKSHDWRGSRSRRASGERRTVHVADHHVDRAVFADLAASHVEVCRFTVRDGYGVGRDLGSSNDAFIQVGELGGRDAREYLGRRGRARCHSNLAVTRNVEASICWLHISGLISTQGLLNRRNLVGWRSRDYISPEIGEATQLK